MERKYLPVGGNGYIPYSNWKMFLKKGIIREIVTKNFGRKAMYRVLLERDKEFQEVLKILRIAPTLPEMFEYAMQQRNMKKASLK